MRLPRLPETPWPPMPALVPSWMSMGPCAGRDLLDTSWPHLPQVILLQSAHLERKLEARQILK